MRKVQSPETALDVFISIQNGKNLLWNFDEKQHAIEILNKAILIIADMLSDYDNPQDNNAISLTIELMRVQRHKQKLINKQKVAQTQKIIKNSFESLEQEPRDSSLKKYIGMGGLWVVCFWVFSITIAIIIFFKK